MKYKLKISEQISVFIQDLIDGKIEEIDVEEMVTEIYGRFDFFIKRTAEVHYIHAKKNFPGYVFLKKKGMITISK